MHIRFLSILFVFALSYTNGNAQYFCTQAPFKQTPAILNPSFEIPITCTNSDNFVSLQYQVPGWRVSYPTYTFYYNACTNFILADHNPVLFPPGMPLTPSLYQFFKYYPSVPQPIPDGKGLVAISDLAGSKASVSGSNYSYDDPKTFLFTNLTTPLKKDSLYQLQFYVGYGLKSRNAAPITYYPTYNVYFTSPPPESFTLYGCTDTTQMNAPTGDGFPMCPLTWSQTWQALGTCVVSGDSGTWVKTAITFSPQQDIQAIAIGPPCERRFKVPNDSTGGYYMYFLDDLQLSTAAVPLPAIDLAGGSFCTGSSTTLRMRFADFYKGSSFQWFKNGQPLAGEVNTTLTTSSSTYGEGFYQCRVQNDSVCLGSDSFHMVWLPQPPEIIGSGNPDTTLCIGDTLHLNAFTDSSISIRWSNGSILPEQTITQSGAYSVTLSNACDTVTATKKVQFNDCPSDFFVPSAFTPNHDGINDVFHTRYRKKPVYYRLSIYNRFGQRLFYSNDPDKGWNGELNSIQQPLGVYVWLIDYTSHDGSAHHLSGTVTLIR